MVNQQASLLDAVEGPNEATFDGETYEPEIDEVRLTGQLERVFNAMSETPGWWSLEGLGDRIYKDTGHRDTPAAISARIRDLRKPKFGRYLVERRRESGGLFRYRLGGKGEGEPESRGPVFAAAEAALEIADFMLRYTEHRSGCTWRTVVCNCGVEAARANYLAARQAAREALPSGFTA